MLHPTSLWGPQERSWNQRSGCRWKPRSSPAGGCAVSTWLMRNHVPQFSSPRGSKLALATRNSTCGLEAEERHALPSSGSLHGCGPTCPHSASTSPHPLPQPPECWTKSPQDPEVGGTSFPVCGRAAARLEQTGPPRFVGSLPRLGCLFVLKPTHSQLYPLTSCPADSDSAKSLHMQLLEV